MALTVLNISLLVYIVLVYALGIGLLVQPSWGLNGLGMLAVIHALVLSAATTHELIHDNVFKQRWANRWAGRLMTHINGACYVPYDDLVQHHFNHHIHHADFVPFDIAHFFQSLPPLLRQFCVFLEWCYFPLFEFFLRGRLMLAPFTNPEKSHLWWRTLLLFCYRGGLIALLTWIALKVLVLYAIAYVCFVNLMRFVDAFHHTYDYVIMGDEIPKRDREYEQAHTFSNVVSARYAWINLLYLNFGYHNAHHHDMRRPWYQLSQLHQSLYDEDSKALLPLPQLIGNYHRFRLDRLFGGQGIVVEDSTDDSLANFTGGIGVSFLTPP